MRKFKINMHLSYFPGHQADRDVFSGYRTHSPPDNHNQERSWAQTQMRSYDQWIDDLETRTTLF